MGFACGTTVAGGQAGAHVENPWREVASFCRSEDGVAEKRRSEGSRSSLRPFSATPSSLRAISATFLPTFSAVRVASLRLCALGWLPRAKKWTRWPPCALLPVAKVDPVATVRTNRPESLPTVRTKGPFVDPAGVFGDPKVDPVPAVRTSAGRQASAFALSGASNHGPKVDPASAYTPG